MSKKPNLTPEMCAFLEKLVNQIEENGLMQYDGIHNGENWVLEEAKELLRKSREDVNDPLLDAAQDMFEALEKIMETELGFAQEYNVYADDSTIYAIAEKALRKARGESEVSG